VVLGPRKEVSAKELAVIHKDKKKLTHPVIGSRAPATTAPKETPIVNPVLTNPTNKPLLFFPESSKTRIKLIVKIPAPPTPLMPLPSKNELSDWAREVTMPPIENSTDATMIQFLGEKICARRAAIGDMLDIAIKYVEVNQLAFAKASNSSAIFDCVVVMPLMFDAV